MEFIHTRHPTADLALVYPDGPRGRDAARVVRFFVHECWNVVRAHAPRVADVGAPMVVFIGLPGRRIRSGGFGAHKVFKKSRDLGVEHIEMRNPLREFGADGLPAAVFAAGFTLIHEAYHSFYEEEDDVMRRTEAFGEALLGWLRGNRERVRGELGGQLEARWSLGRRQRGVRHK